VLAKLTMPQSTITKHKWSFLATTLLTLMAPSAPAGAFTYYEHFRSTASAIQLVKTREPARAARFADLADFMLGTTRLCLGNAILGNPPEPTCFSAPDISALAGDHAASPVVNPLQAG